MKRKHCGQHRKSPKTLSVCLLFGASGLGAGRARRHVLDGCSHYPVCIFDGRLPFEACRRLGAWSIAVIRRSDHVINCLRKRVRLVVARPGRRTADGHCHDSDGKPRMSLKCDRHWEPNPKLARGCRDGRNLEGQACGLACLKCPITLFNATHGSSTKN